MGLKSNLSTTIRGYNLSNVGKWHTTVVVGILWRSYNVVDYISPQLWIVTLLLVLPSVLPKSFKASKTSFPEHDKTWLEIFKIRTTEHYVLHNQGSMTVSKDRKRIQIPSTTLPNTTFFPSNSEQSPNVMKNWVPDEKSSGLGSISVGIDNWTERSTF